jgi:hypothetical protein
MDGFITTITSKAEIVDVEIGDGIAFLGKQGTTIRRNFYGESSGFQWFDSAKDESGKVYLDLGANEGIIDTNQVYWAMPKEEELGADWTTAPTTRMLGHITVNAQEPKFLRAMFLKVQRSDTTKKELTFNVSVTMADVVVQTFPYTMTLGGTSGTDFRIYEIPITFDPPVLARTMGIDITCDTYDHLTHFFVDTTKTDLGSVVINGEVTPGIIRARTTYDTMESVQVGTGSSSSRIYPATEQTWMKEGPEANRGRVFITSGEVSTSDIMSFVARRSWQKVQIGGRCSASVGLARIGGGYALDYLQTMADVVDGTGRRRAFISRERSQIFCIGDRYNVTDEPKMHIVYGGDKTEDGQVPFVSFNPTMTLKNRPMMVTLRATSATGDDSQPVIVSVLDPRMLKQSYGCAPVETVSSTTSVASDRDAVREAYGLLTSNELDSWEGQIVLPGIVSGLIERGGDYAGSGIPIRITDSRNGITDYRARVRQVSHDWNSMTTTITVGNYDLAVLNRISDTIAMASKGNAEAFSAASSATAYQTQYLWDAVLSTDVLVRDEPNTLQIVVSRQGVESTVDIADKSIGLLPDGSAVMQGRIVSTLADVDAYGVVAYIINGTRFNVAEEMRPDFYIGQTLVISLTFVKIR